MRNGFILLLLLRAGFAQPAPHPQMARYTAAWKLAGQGKWDDAIQAFKKAGGLGQGTLIKTYADEQIAQMKKRKAQDAMASR